MHKVTFYPIGNADCCKVDLENGRNLLFDFAHRTNGECEDDPKIDLAETLREALSAEGKDSFDVVAFTHADSDHICGAPNFFYLEHAGKYQGTDRVKIKELWVPAAMVVETNPDLQEDARILRAEARYRLKEGKGIKVFSRPDALKNWLESEKLSVEKRLSCIVDAGTCVPGFDKESDKVEFFVHSPFAVIEDGKEVDRNRESLILQATFQYGLAETKFLIIGDTTCFNLERIVNITKAKGREDRLEWDIYNIPHHCSFHALNDEKGKEITTPLPAIEWLLNQGQDKGLLVSCSKPIPKNDKEDDDQPPHRQAAAYYKKVSTEIDGEFLVTMSHPTEKQPKPLEIGIDTTKARVLSTSKPASSSILRSTSPRAGDSNNAK